MYKVGDLLVYKKDVCKIIEIKEKYLRNMDYYILTSNIDKSLKIQIPTTSKDIRKLITKEEIQKLIKRIPLVETIQTESKNIENDYKQLMQSGTHEDLIKIIKTTYLRNKERMDNNKKTADKDDYYFNQAELYLYNELSIVLNLTYDQTKEYILNEVNRLTS